MPTRNGYSFDYWVLDGYTTPYSGGDWHGIWGEVGGISYTAKAFWTKTVDPWSWTDSNGSATAAQTQQFYNVLRGYAYPESGFSYRVWNDLVDKVAEVIEAYGNSWYAYSGYGKSGCKVYNGEIISASKYNEVRFQIGSILSTGISDRSAEDEVRGEFITILTDNINTIISTML